MTGRVFVLRQIPCCSARMCNMGDNPIKMVLLSVFSARWYNDCIEYRIESIERSMK